MTATASHDSCSDPMLVPGRPARPRLSSDEEIDLVARASSGNRQARDCMVESNLGLVHAIAQHFRGRGLDMDDVVGEGHLGVFRAVERFDPSHGVRFSTYAAHWIKQAIRSALMNEAPAIRVPAWIVKLLTGWQRAERELSRQLGRAPGFEEVAAAMGLSDAQRTMVARALEARRLVPQGGDDETPGTVRLAQVADQRPVDERLEVEEELAAMWRRMDRLDERERTVVSLRYGLEGEVLTLKEIGRRIGVSREWVRKIELRALAKLRDA
jgi:RNA polymerase primary sigma factor